MPRLLIESSLFRNFHHPRRTANMFSLAGAINDLLYIFTTQEFDNFAKAIWRTSETRLEII